MLYQYIDPIGDGNDVFSKLIGYGGSLKEAVSISRAAILYPEGKPNILLTAAKGCGVSYFAQMVFRFAIKAGVVKASASMLNFDCKAYNLTNVINTYVADTFKTGLSYFLIGTRTARNSVYAFIIIQLGHKTVDVLCILNNGQSYVGL